MIRSALLISMFFLNVACARMAEVESAFAPYEPSAEQVTLGPTAPTLAASERQGQAATTLSGDLTELEARAAGIDRSVQPSDAAGLAARVDALEERAEALRRADL